MPLMHLAHQHPVGCLSIAHPARCAACDSRRLLRRLQGTVMPLLLCHGTLYSTDAFFLALSYEGRDLASQSGAVTKQQWGQARRALQKLHSADLCHGDVRAENFVLRADGTVCVVDFEQARVLGSTPHGPVDRTDLQQDLDDLQALMD